MADSRSIVITLKLDKSSGSEDTDISSKTSTKSSSSSSDKDSTAKAIATFAAVQIVQEVAQEAVAWGEYYWNKELILNDDILGKEIKALQFLR